jgi:hypothetical protein
MVQSNDKLINEGLSNLIMKSMEDTHNLLNRIMDTMVIIKESYNKYQKRSHHHNMSILGTLMPLLKNARMKWSTMDEAVNNVMQFLKCSYSGQNFLTSYAMQRLKRTTRVITMDKMYDVTMTQQRESNFRKVSTIDTTY